MRAAIPLADAATFQVSARRTRVLRAALALALVAVLAGAFLLAPGRVRRSAILPPGTSPIIVLDLSWSVSSGSFGEIARTLREVADSNRRVGLVVFSDVAYEELPPGTPSAELRPLLRFFQPPSRGGRHPSLPPSPWSDSLSGGTKIAAGLGLARDILRRDGIDHGSVVLISDLGDAPNNRAELAATIVSYLRDRIPLRVVALHPTPDNERHFRRLLDRPGLVVRAEAGTRGLRRPGPADAGFPVALVAVGTLLGLLLAVNERSCGRLTWREGGAR